MNHGMTYGYKKTLPTIFGQETAVGLIVIMVGFGTQVFISFPQLFFIIKIIGAIWLIFMGIKIIFSVSKKSYENITSVNNTAWYNRLITGFLTDITNVKTWAFMISLMPQFIEPSSVLWKQIVIMAITMMTVDTVMMNIYAFSASYMKKLINNRRIILLQNIIFGSILIIMGTGVLFFTH
ncbi:hypothetical protein CBG25_10100 [Arsenophonus sp. ENCA]|nr:hypothetical protein CBG25_10100 [Arsenophonus sp. ENCA]